MTNLEGDKQPLHSDPSVLNPYRAHHINAVASVHIFRLRVKTPCTFIFVSDYRDVIVPYWTWPLVGLSWTLAFDLSTLSMQMARKNMRYRHLPWTMDSHGINSGDRERSNTRYLRFRRACQHSLPYMTRPQAAPRLLNWHRWSIADLRAHITRIASHCFLISPN
jgi:hypothetical protein